VQLKAVKDLVQRQRQACHDDKASILPTLSSVYPKVDQIAAYMFIFGNLFIGGLPEVLIY
jgi:hypothetical protein